MVKGYPQTLSIWQLMSSTQSCGLWPLTNKVNCRLTRMGAMETVSDTRLQSPPHPDPFWSPPTGLILAPICSAFCGQSSSTLTSSWI